VGPFAAGTSVFWGFSNLGFFLQAAGPVSSGGVTETAEKDFSKNLKVQLFC
jgi:hypothetical protein